MSKKTERVELYERGILKLSLTRSDEGSLNGRSGPNGRYEGRATSAKIFGPAGSGVAFYDDQKFRAGENSVYIEKLTDKPVEVMIAGDFVDPQVMGERGNGVYQGVKEGQYKWMLFKSVKKDWLRRNIPLDWEDITREAEKEGDPRVKAGVKILKALGADGTSDNYRVDNCSSVQFAGPGAS